MTERPMSLGEWIACGAVGLALVGATIGSGIAASGSGGPDDKPTGATCTRTALPGEYRCTLPTSGRPAVVFVETFEDGSSRAFPVDPDGPR